MVTVAIMAVCMSGSCYIISYTSCEVAHSREKQLAAFFFLYFLYSCIFFISVLSSCKIFVVC